MARVAVMLMLASCAMASAFQLPVATLPARVCGGMHTRGSQRSAFQFVHLRPSRRGVLGLRAQAAPPPPAEEEGARGLSKAELADLNIQLLEAGEHSPCRNIFVKRCRILNSNSCLSSCVWCGLCVYTCASSQRRADR